MHRPLRLAVLLLVCLLLGLTPARADDIRITHNGKAFATIDQDGTVFDAEGERVGQIQTDGTVLNAVGNIVGHFEGDGTIRQQNGMIFGRMDIHTGMFFKDGEMIGRIDVPFIYDGLGDLWGHGAGMRKSEQRDVVCVLATLLFLTGRSFRY